MLTSSDRRSLKYFVLFSPLFSLQAYELSTLTGTQVMLLVASETGHVYTFATRKLQPMITSDAGKALIQVRVSSEIPLLSLGEGCVHINSCCYRQGFCLRDWKVPRVV